MARTCIRLPLLGALVACVASLGCGGTERARVTARPTAPAPVDPASSTPAPTASQAVADLMRGVDRLAVTISDPTHAGLAEGLRIAAAAIEELAPNGSEADQMRARARQLEQSGPDDAHAPTVIAGLSAAMSAVATQLADPPTPDLRAAFALASAAIDRLDATQPLLDQEALVLGAFRALTTAVLAVHGLPHADYGIANVASTRSVSELRERVRAFDVAVAKLASAPTWEAARLAAGRSLDALAMVLASVPVRGEREDVLLTTAAVSIRYDAARLRHAGHTHFHKVEWTRHGLAVAADALRGMARDDRFLARWLAPAQRSIDMMSTSRNFVFQRARIQEAFRAMAAACIALDERRGASPTARADR